MLLRLRCPNTETDNWVLKYSKSDFGPGPRWRWRGVARCGQTWQWWSCHWWLHQDHVENGGRKGIWVLAHIGQDGVPCHLRFQLMWRQSLAVFSLAPIPELPILAGVGRSSCPLCLHAWASGPWSRSHLQLLSADGSGLVLGRLNCRHCLSTPVSLPPGTRT